MRIFFIILTIFTTTTIHAQYSGSCIYWSHEEFAEDICDLDDPPVIDKELGKKGKMRRYIVKGRRSGKRLKNAFAVVIDGELYFQIKSVTRNLAKRDRLPYSSNDKDFVKVVSTGAYEYLEYDTSDDGSGLNSGVGSGIGIGLGYSFNIGGKKSVRGMIYDPQNFEFNMFYNCKDFNNFLMERHPNRAYECKKKKLDIETVRRVMNDINRSSVSTSVEEEITNGKSITIYPHRSIVNNACALEIGEKKLNFDDLSILDLTVNCDASPKVCITDTDICLDIKCDDDVSYYIVSRDKENDVHTIEASNEKDYKYYSALMKRRQDRKRK